MEVKKSLLVTALSGEFVHRRKKKKKKKRRDKLNTQFNSTEATEDMKVFMVTATIG